MSLQVLSEKIEKKTAKIAVIGLGYVGLPVAALFAEAGFDVLGIDIKAKRVEEINAGNCPIEGKEPGLAELFGKVVAAGQLRAATDYKELKDYEIITISVETPVDENNKPRYEALRSVLEELGPVIKEGALVIVESTIAPGTMDQLVQPLLEDISGKRVGEGFYLGHCPERVMPGKLLANLRGVSRVCGGDAPGTAAAMCELYAHVVEAELDPATCITAELVKTAENAYRDVNIAFANEVALVCESLGGDVWQVRDLVNKSPGRNMLLPGAGVGGHCIPKDPWLLIANAGDSFTPRLIPAARAVNDGMPLHVVNLATEALREVGIDITQAKVVVLGYAYLENSDDTRNSPSAVLVKCLEELGAQVVIHDPWIPEYQGNLEKALENTDAAIVMVAHDEYRALDLHRLRQIMQTPVIVDGRRIFKQGQARIAGVFYRSVGVGYQEN